LSSLGEGVDVLGLGQPVHSHRHDVLGTQEHVLALLENVQHIGLDVLAGQAKQHACLLLGEHEALQIAMARRQLDSRGAIFADHAVP
jgi:hypothetical protein